MKLQNTLLLGLIALLISSCGLDPIDEHTLYFNGFNSEEDLELMTGNAYALSEDSAEGKNSLSVCGGCVGPHGDFSITFNSQTDKILISLTGKTLDFGGGVSFRNPENLETYVDISVIDTIWTEYEVVMDLPAGDNTLDIAFVSGGIAASTTLFDALTIEEVPE